MSCRSTLGCIHFACKHTHLNVRWQTPVHHETETKAPFRLGLSVNRAFPMRRSHSSILPANSWHWTTAEPTSMFLSVRCLYNEAGGWRPVLDGTETHNEWFCLVSFHSASHHMRSCESGCVRRSALYHAGRSCVPSHEVSRKERQFAIKWKRGGSDWRHTLLGQMLHQRGIKQCVYEVMFDYNHSRKRRRDFIQYIHSGHLHASLHHEVWILQISVCSSRNTNQWQLFKSREHHPI